MNVHSRIMGASLFEVMVVLLLSTMLLMEIFRYSYFLEKSVMYAAAQVDILEKNNVLFGWMVNDIEMAGYAGCVDGQFRSTLMDEAGYLKIPWLIVNEKTLFSQYMSTEQFPVLEKISENELLITGNNHLKEDDIVFIENCWEAQVIKIKKIRSRNYGAQNILQFYTSVNLLDWQAAFVGKLVQHQYAVLNTTRKNTQGSFISSLYVTDARGDKNEILENMRLLVMKKSQKKVMISVLDDENQQTLTLNAKIRNAS